MTTPRQSRVGIAFKESQQKKLPRDNYRPPAKCLWCGDPIKEGKLMHPDCTKARNHYYQ